MKKIQKILVLISLSLSPLSPNFVKAANETEPPSVPQNLTITKNTDSTVSLSWNFSIDNSPLPVTYNILVNNGVVGSSTSTTYTVKNLTPLTSYNFTVAAVDGYGNTSDPSSVLAAQTTEDKIPPVVDILFPLNNQSVDGQAVFTASSTDDVKLTNIEFVLDGASFSSPSESSPLKVNFDSNAYAKNSSHTLTARAYDSSGNIGTKTVSFGIGKLTAPQPSVINVSEITANSATVTWQTSIGCVGSLQNTSGNYSGQALESTATTYHTIHLNNLKSLTSYSFIAVSSLQGLVDATSSPFSFTTTDFVPTPTPTPQAASNYSGTHPDGTLVLDGQTVYLIKNQSRVAFRDGEEYKSYGYNFSQAVTVTAQDKNLPQASIAKAMEGTLVLDKSDQKTVYMVGTNGTKRGFSSAEVFTGLGYVFSGLSLIDMSDYQTGAVINSKTEAHPDGALVLDNKTVWWIRGNTRQGFESEAVFNTYGFSFSKIVPSNAGDMALPEGPIVKFRDGTLVNDSGNYYIISNSKKFKFSSASDLQNRGYNLSNVLSTSLSAYEDGGNLQ